MERTAIPPISQWLLGPRTRQGILLFFALGVLAPSAFLGALGFRYFRYERLMLHRQSEERHRAVADDLQTKAERTIREPWTALKDLAASAPFTSADRPTMIRRLLALSVLGACPVEERYLIDEEGQVIFPALPATGAAFEERETDWGPISDDIERLERLEFAEKKYAEALAGYQALRAKALPAALQAALLQNIVSAARRSGDHGKAEASARQLIEDFDAVLDASGVPFGIRGRQHLIKLYEATGRAREAALVRAELLEGLTLQRWPGTPHAAEFFEETASVNAVGPVSRAVQWRKELERLQKGSRSITSNAWPQVLRRLKARGWLDTGGTLRWSTRKPESWLVAAPFWNGTGERRQGWLAVVISADTVQWVLDRTLKEEVPLSGLQVSLSGAQTSSGPFWPASFSRSLAVIDPPLLLRFHAPSTSVEDPFVQRRFWMYGGTVVLSFVIVLIGFVLMVQAIKREGEIATLKADFVASVSHELRTPLMSINYIGERLRGGRYRSEEEVKELYGMLGEESSRLQAMVEEVLEFSRMLSGRRTYDLQEQDLAKLIDQAVSRMRTRAQAEGFQLDVSMPSAPVQIYADAAAALQAITNLIDNALKYSGDKRRIRVEAAQNGSRGVVRVIDEGPGIAPQDRERIFEKFERASETAKGVGLGLAMVKQIMEAHGGKVTVESEPGLGSTFTLHFPLWKDKGPET